MKLMRTKYAVAALSLAIAGCNVGPDYKQPEVKQVAGNWSEPTNAPATQPMNLAQWWTTFNDPMLNSLIERAANQNLDLKSAQARVLEARALRQVTGADEWPTVNANASAERRRISRNGTLGSGVTVTTPKGTGRVAGFGFKPESNLFQAGFDSSWEIDVFGGQRRAIEAAEANEQAAVEDQRDVMISVMAEVARNYIELRTLQLRLELTHNNVKSEEETADLTRTRLRAGLTNELDVTRAEAQVATTTAQLPLLSDQRDAAIHRLSVLLGQSPGELAKELDATKPLPATPASVPAGLPSEILRRRPDVRRAERQLAAATANIGVATADLFPKFSLTGSLGLSSTKYQSLANHGSSFWSIGPSVSWPIFDAGRIRAGIRVQNARQELALNAYTQTVLLSLEDVENSLSAYQKEQARRDQFVKAVQANQRSVDLANQLYSRGLTDFFNVLDAQRNLFAAQDALAQSDGAVSANLVSLYKALGGGWREDDVQKENAQSNASEKAKENRG